MLSAAVAGGGSRAVWAMLVAVQTVLVIVLTPVGCIKPHYVNPADCSFNRQHSLTSVECDLSDLSDLKEVSIKITANNTDRSVSQIRIVNAFQVEVGEGALSALNNLESIHFENITNLDIDENTPGASRNQGQVSVTLNRIGYLRMSKGSFSHWKEKTLSISIANIEDCYIFGGAIVSSSFSTKVVLENITDARFYSGTFAATLGELALNNVTMTVPCRNNTFTGRIGKLSLISVKIESIKEGCFRLYGVKSLTLRELQFHIPCECNIRKKVRELFFGPSPLSIPAKHESAGLLQSAYGSIRCLHNQTTPFLREYYCTNCSPRLETICVIDETSSASAAPSWVPLVALCGCFLVLGAVISLLVIRHRRRSAPQRRTPCPKRPPSQRLTVADLQPHPLPDLQRDGQHIDTASQSPGGEKPGEVPRTGAAGSMVDSSVYTNVPEATAGSGVCENVSGLASGNDQALYEEISPQGQTRGEKEAEFIADSTQPPPLYAEVNKGKGKSDITSDDFGYAADSSDPPVYAQVDKTKARTIQRSRETAHQTANTGTSGTEAAGNVSETSPTDDTTADMPVYAQVSKNKPDGKKRSVNKQAGHPELEQTPLPPVYAQVKKNQPTASSQTNHHDPSQQTWQPSDTPLYEEVSRLTPEESPLYAGIMYSAAGSADSKENDDFSEGLHYNELYGVSMSPTD